MLRNDKVKEQIGIEFYRTLKRFHSKAQEIINRNMRYAIGYLLAKHWPGKDIIVYGGASFVSSLISQNLVDEYYIFRRPVAIGNGLSLDGYGAGPDQRRAELLGKRGEELHEWIFPTRCFKKCI